MTAFAFVSFLLWPLFLLNQKNLDQILGGWPRKEQGGFRKQSCRRKSRKEDRWRERAQDAERGKLKRGKPTRRVSKR